MDDLNPITRTERLLDGEDLTPTNREEMFIKRIYDKTQEIPEPVNRKEYFLKKAGEAGGDVTVVPLSVTDNGIYSEEGKAYSPVTVSVQPPANSYQLKSITTPTSLATFNASAMPMPTLKVSVEAKQDLHGYDHPWVGGAGKNKYSGTDKSFTRETVITLENDLPAGTWYFSAKINCNSPDQTLSVIFRDVDNNMIGTLYIVHDSTTRTYGSANVTSNIHSLIIRAGASYTSAQGYTATYTDIMLEIGEYTGSYEPYSNICPISGWDAAIVTDTDDLTNPTVTQTTTISLGQTVYGGEVDVVNGVLKITDGYIASYNGETLPSTWISSMDVYAEGTTPTTGAEVCYELATPTTISLTPSLIKSLNGQNNLSMDCGDVIEGEYFKALGGE